MASATKALPNTSNARSEVSARIKLSRLSTVRRRHSSLICGFELFGNMETVERMVLSRWLLHDTCMSALWYWWSIWTGLMHERHINWQDWQDIELAQVLVFFRHGKSCSMLCLFLLETRTGNMIPDSTGFLEALTQQHQQPKNLPNTRFEVSAKLKLSRLSTVGRRHSFVEDGN